jgi:PAS domain S-box-containing protein
METLQNEVNMAQRYLDTVGAIVVAIDTDQKIAFINKKGCSILGCKEREVIGKNWFNIFVPERVRDEVKAGFERLIAGEIEPIEYFENPVLTKGGEEKIISWHNNVLRNSKGNIIGTISSGQDITERKKAERKLPISAAIIDAMADGLILFDMNGKVVSVNPACEKMTGYEASEVVGKPVTDFVLKVVKPVDHEKVFVSIKNSLENKKITPFVNFTLVSKDGREIPINSSTAFIKDAEGTPTNKIVMIRDITERKLAEEELARAASIIDAMADGLVLLDMNGKVVSVNPAYEKMTGYEASEVVGKPAFDVMQKLIKPEEWEEFAGALMASLEGQLISPETYTFISKNGQEISVFISTFYIKDAGGNPTNIIIMIRDITDLKQAQEKLWESEERFRGIAERSLDEIFTADSDGNMTYVSPALLRITGYSPEEILGKEFQQYINESDIPKASQALSGTLKGENVEGLQLGIRKKDGSLVDVEINASPIIRDGEVVGAQGIVRDITERKRAEREQARAAAVINAMADGLILLDMDGKIVSVNPAYEKMTGYEASEMIGKSAADAILKLIKPEDREEAAGALASSLEGQLTSSKTYTSDLEGRFTSTLTFTLVSKNGQRILINGSVAFIKDAEGNPTNIIAMIRDITDLKQVQEKLRESEERFRGIAERSLDEVFTADSDGNMTYVSPASLRIMGYTPEEALGKSYQQYITESDIPKAVQELSRILKGENVEGLQLDLRKKDGSLVNVEVNASPIIRGGEVVGAQGIMRDITERKRAERELARAATIIDAMDDGLILLDMDGNIVSVNPACEKISGYEASELVGKPVTDFVLKGVKPEDYEEVFAAFKASLESRKVTPFVNLTMVSKDGREIPINSSASFIRDAEGNPTNIIVMFRDITDLKRADEMLKRMSVSRPLVAEMLHDLLKVGGLSEKALFSIGEKMAARIEAERIPQFLETFADVGLGTLTLVETDKSQRRWIFSGDGLVGLRPGSDRPTGNFALGFLCGALTRVLGGVRVAGVEVACQSMGDELCRFVVQVVG